MERRISAYVMILFNSFSDDEKIKVSGDKNTSPSR